MPMSLNQLLPQAEAGVLIRELTLDSRAVKPGDLFLAIPGAQHDGRAHIADAVARGAAAIAYEAEGASVAPIGDTPLVAIKGLAAQLSAIAGRFYGEPSRGIELIGVTGTNGKTSVSQLLAQALDLLGQRCGIVGTLGNGFHDALESGKHTTPDALALQATQRDASRADAVWEHIGHLTTHSPGFGNLPLADIASPLLGPSMRQPGYVARLMASLD